MTTKHIKILAIIIMTIDHIAEIIGQAGLMVILPGATMSTTYWLLHIMNGIGRIAFPLFAFMISEGCEKTRSMPRYIGRLALFAFISEPLYYFAFSPLDPSLFGFFKSFMKFHWANIFFTLAIGVSNIYIYQLLERKSSKRIMVLFIPVFLISLFVGGSMHCEYGVQGILLIVALYLAKTKYRKIFVILIWSIGVYWIWLGSLFNFICAAFACVFVWLYNGKLGKMQKWSFYFYYPVHLGLLTLVNTVII